VSQRNRFDDSATGITTMHQGTRDCEFATCIYIGSREFASIGDHDNTFKLAGTTGNRRGNGC
jgi:hypothetical protein